MRCLGNGISLLIFAGIAAGLPNEIGQTLEQLNTGAYSTPLVLGIAALVIVVTAFVVFVERALRKILVNYAKRQVGNKVYQGQSSHLPLKLNMAGVIPPIFASSIILFPATLASWFGAGEGTLIGPNLHGVFGRPAATLPEFDYSPALEASALVWTPVSLEAWLADPAGFVAGTTMAFSGYRLAPTVAPTATSEKARGRSQPQAPSARLKRQPDFTARNTLTLEMPRTL